MMNYSANGLGVYLAMWWLLSGGPYSGLPPATEDPSIRLFAPTEPGLLYFSWNGQATGNRAKPIRESPAMQRSAVAENRMETLLADSEFQIFSRSIADWNARVFSNSADTKPFAEIGLTRFLDNPVVQHLCAHAGCVFVSSVPPWKDGPGAVRATLVLQVGANGAEPLLAAIQELVKILPGTTVKKSTENGVPKYIAQPSDGYPTIEWQPMRDYVIVGIGEGQAAAAVRLFSESPRQWLTAARDAVQVPNPISFMHVDVPRLLNLLSDVTQTNAGEHHLLALARSLGLADTQSISIGRGLDDQGIVQRGRCVTDLRQGLFTLLTGSKLAAGDVESIDPDSPLSLSMRVDPSQILKVVLDALNGMSDEGREMAIHIENEIASIDSTLGIHVVPDLAESTAGVWQVFAQPGPQAWTHGWVLRVKLHDVERFSAVHDKFFTAAQENLPILTQNKASLRQEKQDERTVQSMRLAGAPWNPAWCIQNGELTIATSKAKLTTMLNRPATRENSLAAVPKIKPWVTEHSPTLLAHVNIDSLVDFFAPLLSNNMAAVAETFKVPAVRVPWKTIKQDAGTALVAIEEVPQGVEWTVRHPFPSVDISRVAATAIMAVPIVNNALEEAPNRQRDMVNMRRLGLAIHNFASENHFLPAGYSIDKKGNPLLSWRVHVLPYLEQVELYRQFHLDEPWDSAHNKPLIRKMPDVYKSKNRDVPQGHTVYLGVAGRNGVFVRPAPNQPGCLGIEMGEVQDGTSATAMLVRVPDEIAELWTKPGDFAPHDDDLWQRLAGENSSGVTITRVDGSTGFLPSSANVEQVRALFTRGGGELMKIEF